MWSARILTGAQAGQLMDLKPGRNLVGRAPHCEVLIASHGVSKEHCEIQVYKDKVMLVDLKSSNGTFLNGVRIQNGIIRVGDKVSIHDILLEILPRPDIRPQTRSTLPTIRQSRTGVSAPMSLNSSLMHGNAAPQTLSQHSVPEYNPNQSVTAQANSNTPAQSFWQQQYEQFHSYMERVALPGVYKLADLTDFKTVIGGFILIFILSVTTLSMFPMLEITKEGIINESMKRAASLARSVGQANQQAYMEKNHRGFNTHSVESEDGVKQVFIVEKIDGSIVAPASREGTSSNLPFVTKARNELKSMTEQIDSNTIAASYPIGQYDPNTGEPVVKAYAIVVYDITSLSFDSGRAISLFMQTLLIASVIGFFIFYLMYSLIEFPIRQLSEKLDNSLREKTDNIRIPITFPLFQDLVGNINSLLSRSLSAGAGDSPVTIHGKDVEADNLVQMMMLPCAAFNSQNLMINCNSRFEQFARSTALQMKGQGFNSVADGSLRQNLESLIKLASENPQGIHTDSLEFSGQACTTRCQAFATNGSIDYYIVVIAPTEGGTE